MDLRLEKKDNVSNISKKYLVTELEEVGDKKNEWAVLECDDGFIQCCVLDKKFYLEYRDKKGQLFKSQKENFTHAEIVKIFISYYDKDSTWNHGIIWGLDEVYERKSNLKRYIGFDTLIILIVVALIIASLLQSVNAYLSFDSTEGVVVGVITNNGRSKREMHQKTYAPIVEYWVNNQKYTLRSNVFNHESLVIQEKIAILYSPKYPEKAKINNFSELWLLPILLLVFLGCLLRSSHRKEIHRK